MASQDASRRTHDAPEELDVRGSASDWQRAKRPREEPLHHYDRHRTDEPRYRPSKRRASRSPRRRDRRLENDYDHEAHRPRSRSPSSSSSPKNPPPRRHRRHRESPAHSHRELRTLEELPFGARRLHRSSDLDVFRPLFARYLEVQKQLDIADLNEREVRGRWKSFVAKWNKGELAQGWYDATVFEDAVKNADRPRETTQRPRSSGTRADGERSQFATPPLSGRRFSAADTESAAAPAGEDEDGSEDEYGPVLPQQADRQALRQSSRHGPGIPSLQDLEVQRELADEERSTQVDQLRLERKLDRREQKARIDELVPRAEAGTRERQLEKKREVNEKMKSFRERSPGAAVEVGDKELMGGGDSLDDYKRIKADNERRKTEREIRREEIQRAKMEEREERLREYREREENTMSALKQLAKQRFG